MRIGLRLLRQESVNWLRQALVAGELSRYGLARGLCLADGWLNPKHEPCVASAAKALPQLASELGLSLPPAQARPGQGRPRRQAQAPQTRCRGPLPRLGTVRLRPVRSAAERALWRAMLEEHHPQGAARAPGCRMSWLLESEVFGTLGGMSFVAAPMRLGPRDRWLGWSDRARGAHIARIVSQDRFLLLPGVRVQHLASHALKLARQALTAGWKTRHGLRPLLLETCVDGNHRGVCYRAAGWKQVGRTRGRPPGRTDAVDRKRVFVLKLGKGVRDQLCAEPQRKLGCWPALPASASFAEREFGRSDLPDGRLRRRLLGLAAAWEKLPGMDLPTLFPGDTERKAAYRFLHNPKVAPADILQPHREALAERCRRQGTVLLVQDTTTLNWTRLKDSSRGLGPLQKRSDSSRGLFVHAALAFTEGRRPLGVSGLESWARPLQEPSDEREKESARWLRGFEQALEVGRACPHTRVIAVGDRESDMWSLFERQAQCGDQAGLLVRASRGSQRDVLAHEEDGDWRRPLFDHMDFAPVVATRKIEIAARGGPQARPRRVARTEVSADWVPLQPPKTRPGAEPLEVLAVRVLERDEPEGEDPLEWLLLTSEGQPGKADALRAVQRYENRWGIEEFFRVLKSGMRIEDRQLRTAESLQRCLAFDAVNAWRVFELQRYARDAPETPAPEVLSETEMEVIEDFVQGRRLLPASQRERPPPEDIRGWVVRLARIAGFRPWKRQPLPGNQVLWKAWKIVQICVLHEEARAARA